MYTLGIHGGINTVEKFGGATPANWLHDASAVLCRDGEVVAAAEEERFVRIKHVNYFPIQAIRYCLKQQHIEINDVAQIVVASQHMSDFLRLTNRWRFGTRAWRHLDSGLDVTAAILQDEFGVDVRSRLSCAGHHRAHALSAVWQSGFESSLCVVMDGWGDRLTGLILAFRNGKLDVLRELDRPGPAGMYLRGTELLGFSQFDEYKVMGLAPYGNPGKYLPELLKTVSFDPDGRFELTDSLTPELFSADRAVGAPLEQRHKDFAAALQLAAEKVLFHVVEHFRQSTGLDRLCLAGGLAQNCTANGKLLTSGLFKEVFVQPVAYDAGCAIGAAIHGFTAAGGLMRHQRLAHVYLGENATEDSTALASTCHAWRNVLDVEQHSNISEVGAQLLADGHVIGWVQGRAEFGARALGNRSILADPRPSENKRRINAMVKKREEFRPFAPSVLEQRLHQYFEVPEDVRALPFMVFVVRVREQYRRLLGAVTHVDGTARVQSVCRETNPRYFRLLESFDALTGVPIVLNTSFNNNHEPIVNTASEAINSFLSTQIDYLIVGDFLVKRRAGMDPLGVLRHLSPRMSHRFEAIRHSLDGKRLEHALRDRHTDRRLALSAQAHDCLVTAAERRIAFGEVLGHAAADAPTVLEELLELWCRRVFHCEPGSL